MLHLLKACWDGRKLAVKLIKSKHQVKGIETNQTSACSLEVTKKNPQKMLIL